MEFFLGTQSNLQSVQIPTTGLERARTKYRSTGVLTNGGGWARESVSGHNVYNMNWDFIRNDAYAKINSLIESGDLIHFLDPQAAASNSLPSYIAQAGDATRGGHRMVGYSATSAITEVTTLAPLVTTGPTRTAAYTGITSAPRKSIWLPIPTGHRLWLRGLTSGAAKISLSGDPNALTDARLTATVMSLNGATVVDTRPTAGAPDGGQFFRRTMTTANTTSPMSMPLEAIGTGGIPTTPAATHMFSVYAQKNVVGGPQVRMDVTWYNAAGTSISTTTGTPVTATTSWARYSQAFTAPALAAFARPALVWTGTALVAQVLDFAQAQFEPGTVMSLWTDGFLPAYVSGTTAPQMSMPAGSSQGTYLSIGAGADITIRWLQAQVLPEGTTPTWTAGWQPGLGHSGCRLDGDPGYTLYSAPQALDFGALSVVLRETGAWE